MKKIASIITLVLILGSCSTDKTPNASVILPTKRVEINAQGNISYTTIFSYEGNKIVTASNSDGTKISFTYTGNLITKTESFDAKNVVTNTFDYYYTNGKVTLVVQNEKSLTTSYKTTYDYNADGTVSYEFSVINLVTNVYISHQIGKYTFANGNLIKDEYSFIYENSPNAAPGFATEVYEYDTNPNPFTNVLGGGIIVGSMSSVNNRTKSTQVVNGITSPNGSISYSYNLDGFPILVESQGSFYKVQYIY